MNQVTVVDKNPVVFFKEVEQYSKQGYMFSGSTFEFSSGFFRVVSTTNDAVIVPQLGQDIEVSTYDKYNFILQFNSLVIAGYEVDWKTFDFNVFGKCHAKFLNPKLHTVYDRSYLTKVDIEELKEIARLHNTTLRGRTKIIYELSLQGKVNEDVVPPKEKTAEDSE